MRNRLADLARAQFVRFALTGALVAAVYFAVATALIVLADAPAQLAVVIAYVCSIALHFTVNRGFVFSSTSGYAFHLSAQGGRYLLVALSSYALTALAVALAGSVGLPELVVALATPVAFTALNFFVLRAWVFRPGTGSPARAETVKTP
jgi:putative flippase GtrA